MLTIKCRHCQQDVAIDLQERFQYFDKTTTPPTKLPTPVKIAPALHITCRNRACKLHDVTFTVESVLDYEAREISDKFGINR